MDSIKEMLAKEFEVKDFGILRYFLGMEFARSKRGIFVSQRIYALEPLKETVMLGSKPSKTIIELRDKRKMFEGSLADKWSYQQLIGKLIYLSHTRANIAFAVSLVSQYMHDPCQGHLDISMQFGSCTLLWGNLVKWWSKKQIVFTRSSPEAEYRAMAHGVCETIWIKNL
ncbi:uncharacterized mitochondrial protein AtMg00810-like [Humulus lupulus]|uniref:uncharacterized mitochondrial protein AtMg00810-like n=1 Tax=Humulus lupulus TaxID=3486 RepID=UPI002B4054FB|nr:uncharacterized mitochondrial protein AtMg00810-like [Humulus lupulus]